jgi:hypothetical protein
MHNNGIVRRFVSIYLESRATPGNSASSIYIQNLIDFTQKLVTRKCDELKHHAERPVILLIALKLLRLP